MGARVLGDEVPLGAVAKEDMNRVLSPNLQKITVNPPNPNIPHARAQCTLPTARNYRPAAAGLQRSGRLMRGFGLVSARLHSAQGRGNAQCVVCMARHSLNPWPYPLTRPPQPTLWPHA